MQLLRTVQISLKAVEYTTNPLRLTKRQRGIGNRVIFQAQHWHEFFRVQLVHALPHLSASVLAWMMLDASMPCRIMFMIAMT
jgi:hypothetical protein